MKLSKPKKPVSRSIVANSFVPFVSLFDPDRIVHQDEVGHDDEAQPDVLPMRLGKSAFKSYRARRYKKATHCVYCGWHTPEDKRTVDHITPLSRSGPNHPANLAMSCIRCNRKKGDLTPREWTEKIHAKLDYYRTVLEHLEELIDGDGADLFPAKGLSQEQAHIESQRAWHASQTEVVASD